MTRDAAIFFIQTALQFFGRDKIFFSKRPVAQPFFGRAENPVVMALREALPFFWQTNNSVVIARPEALLFVGAKIIRHIIQWSWHGWRRCHFLGEQRI